MAGWTVAGWLFLPIFLPLATAQQTIGRVEGPSTTQDVQVAGAITLQGNTLLLGNGSTVTAGQHTLAIHLVRGGDLDLCATTSVHLSQQKSPSDPNSPLMLALSRGALEAHYTLGKDSDVVLTPDLRILLSGPGKADVRIRVNQRGDTCVENHGDGAPYVTVSEEMGTGVYRVQPNQRVLFERGSLRSVVDNEPVPCGCPATPVISIASTGNTGNSHIAQPGQKVASAASANAGPSSTPADTAFPIAESEGLASPPGPPAGPVVAPGQPHVVVSTTLAYDANHPRPTGAAASGAPTAALQTPAAPPTTSARTAPTLASTAGTMAPATAQAPPPAHKPSSGGIFHHIGHFFKRIFGKG
ncbi:MAG: hypothetical protein ACP5EP_02535 [Acidobacteriaceae bacterium]